MSDLKAGRERVRAWKKDWPAVALIVGLLASVIWSAGLLYGAYLLAAWTLR